MFPKRIGPYRIDGLLGRGGMGEVYRAHDEQLRRPVAIKQIRTADLADPTAEERFWREARSAAKLVHPAIVQVYHMLHEKDRDYIVMELVEGRTLSELLQDGPVAPADAAALGRDIAEGLAEAHAQNIVHRDIKAENVMITSASRATPGRALPGRATPGRALPGRALPGRALPGRAKILDFGLAKRLTATTRSLSATGMIVGTLYTMSPEQAQGEDVDHRTDLFSLGALLYQALTGVAPFRAQSARETLARVCTFNPPPPTQVSPRVPPAFSELVVRLLQKDPANRPQSAAEVAAELGRFVAAVDVGSTPSEEATAETSLSPTLPLGSGAQRILAKPRRRALLAALAAVILMALVATLVWHLLPAGTKRGPSTASPSVSSPSSPPARPDPLVVRPAVAVLGFENLSTRPEDAGWAIAISERLIAELRAGGQLRVVRSGEVARARQELALGPLPELATDDLARVGRSLGVGIVLWGTFGVHGASFLRIELRLEDVVGGENLASEEATGTVEQLLDLVDRIAKAFREQLGVDALTPVEERLVQAALPTDEEALRLYSEGLGRLRQLDFLAARDLLQAAIAAEPGHPMPRAALAETWAALGYDREARDAASKARELGDRLSETDRRLIEARYFEVAQQWDRAAGIYSELFATFGDDIELGLQLAAAQTEAGELSSALATLAALRRLPEPVALDPRIDLRQAGLAYRQGDFVAARDLAETAARKGENLQAPFLVAEALLVQTTVFQALGDPGRAATALDEALRLFAAHGARRSVKILELTALEVLAQGELIRSQKLFEKALAAYLEIGNRHGTARVQGSLGSILVSQGELQEAMKILDRALSTFRELGNQHDAAIALNNSGAALFQQGELRLAVDRYEEALELSKELDDQSGIAFAFTNIGETLYVLGELDQARKMHEESLLINLEIRDKSGTAYDTFRLGKIFAAQGNLLAARRRYENALADQNELEEAGEAAATRLELAVLDLFDGDPQSAERLARQSEEVLRNEGWSDRSLLAGTVLSRALLVQDRLAEARETIAALEPAAVKSADHRVRWLASIAACRVQAQEAKEAPAAVAELDELAAEATAAGYVEESFEARLAAAEIEQEIGRAATAATRLRELAEEATSRGYLQVARRAVAISSRLALR